MHTCACLSWYFVYVGDPSLSMQIKFSSISLTVSKFPINVAVPLACSKRIEEVELKEIFKKVILTVFQGYPKFEELNNTSQNKEETPSPPWSLLMLTGNLPLYWLHPLSPTVSHCHTTSVLLEL